MAEPTPGPWELGTDKRGHFGIFAGSYRIARALTQHGLERLPTEVHVANARLIAAAPELLAVVKAAFADDECEVLGDSWLLSARRIIDKAEGR